MHLIIAELVPVRYLLRISTLTIPWPVVPLAHVSVLCSLTSPFPSPHTHNRFYFVTVAPDRNTAEADGAGGTAKETLLEGHQRSTSDWGVTNREAPEAADGKTETE